MNPGYVGDDGFNNPRPGYSNEPDRRDSDGASQHSNPDHARNSHHWAKEETPRDAAVLLDALPSKQFGEYFIQKLNTPCLVAASNFTDIRMPNRLSFYCMSTRGRCYLVFKELFDVKNLIL